MIRTELGDKLFEKALKYFLVKNQYQNVNSWDFLDAIEKSTGKNLKPLFDQYVFRGGHPDFKISFSWDNENKLGILNVTQKQASSDDDYQNLFDLKIPVAFGVINKETNIPIFTTSYLRINKKEQNFYFPLAQKPDFVSFDPDNNYLKTVELDISLTELKNQLYYDTDIINKIYAAEAIAKKNNLEALKILTESLKNDTFWSVRAEVASQIGNIKLDQTVDVLLDGLKDSDSRVRKSIIDALTSFATPQVFQAIYQIAKDGDPSYYTESKAISTLGILAFKLKGEYIDKAIQLFDDVLKTRTGWNEIVRSGAITGLANLKDSSIALDKIIDYTAVGTSEILRRSTLKSLGDISSMQKPEDVERIIDILDDASKDEYILTQRSLIAALGNIKSKRVIPILSKIRDKAIYGRIKNLADEAIHKASDNLGSEKTINQIRDEVTSIKKENQKLKSRLEELEAKAKEKSKAE
jgi:aminopeptidase N